MPSSILLSVVAVLSSYLATLHTTVVYIAPLEEPVVIVVEKVELRPELVPICACESSFEGNRYGTPQQFEKDGVTVRYGRVNPEDRGMCQLNRKYHGDAAQKMGFDIETEEGNILYSNWLYSKQGAKPWGWSKGCHGRG